MLWTAPGVKLPSYRKNGFKASWWRGARWQDGTINVTLIQVIPKYISKVKVMCKFFDLK